MPLTALKDKYTYQDYLTWPDEERWELIGGIAHNMTPAPNTKHQRILSELSRIIGNALHGKKCTLFVAPTDVILSETDVVQPDVFVVCDPKKITDKNIQGAPELIIEILSPSTSKKDRWDKKNLYEKYGILEYILVDPDGQYVERYLLEKSGHYGRGEAIDAQTTMTLKSISTIEIPLWEIFEVERIQS